MLLALHSGGDILIAQPITGHIDVLAIRIGKRCVIEQKLKVQTDMKRARPYRSHQIKGKVVKLSCLHWLDIIK